ncbi:MAG: XRE family transcriptional regulator [Candidatus Hydrogenedentota bacterium]
MNGERIRLARKKAGLSLRDLAAKMEGLVSAQAIGKYERGEMAPGSEVSLALSKALGVSMYYLSAPQQVELGELEFRTKANTSAKDRARVETEVLEWVERYLQIEEILGEGGGWKAPEGMPRRISSLEEAEDLAEELRHSWDLGIDPIVNMTELLEEGGIKTLLADLPGKVSGFTCLVKSGRGEQKTPVIVVNRGQTLERRRFNMAHELGHRVIDSESVGEMEKLCHRFAGGFLVNRRHLMKEIGQRRSALGVREILDLKRHYRVSAAALLLRLQQTGILGRRTVQKAFQTFARQWRSVEPEPLEDPEDKPSRDEEPRRFERLVYRAAAEDMISLSKAVELLRAPLAEVEAGLRGVAHADNRRR